MNFISNRVKSLQPYLFSEFHRRKLELQKNGVDVIDLGIGAPDLPTPEFIIKTLQHEINDPNNHRYSPYQGTLEFREAVAEYYRKRYQVDLDPMNEIVALIGSKEGLANFAQAVINPGDMAIVPNPGYPVYQNAIALAGGKSIDLPLDAQNGYNPRFDKLTEENLNTTKLMILNYPSNPTAGTVELKTFMEGISLAKKHEFIIAHDAAYDLMTFGDYQSPSILQVPGAKDVAIEFGSLSKSFNMTGWRIGYAVGNKELIGALATLKSNIDTSQFLPIQKAAITALKSDLSFVQDNNKIFEGRMNQMHQTLNEVGLKTTKPKGTFYLWVKVPDNFTSKSFAENLLNEAGVIVTPGHAFGTLGEGYFRISLTVNNERLNEVRNRLLKIDF